MKYIVIMSFLMTFARSVLCQTYEYEYTLAQHMSDFKTMAQSDSYRAKLAGKMENLLDQIKIQVNLSNSNSSEYSHLRSTQRKIEAFCNYINCLSINKNVEFSKQEFDYINDLLDINPQELTNLKCNSAAFYEVTLGKFKATFVHNKRVQTDPFDYKLIHIEYDCINNGQLFQRGSFNLAGNNVQVMEFLSDTRPNYYKIASVRCSEVKSLLPK